MRAARKSPKSKMALEKPFFSAVLYQIWYIGILSNYGDHNRQGACSVAKLALEKSFSADLHTIWYINVL